MTDFARQLVKAVGDSDTSIADDEKAASEFTGYVDTGSLALNALLCGSMYGGIPNNKVIAFAGESGVGKTYFALSIAKSFLDTDQDTLVVLYDTEAAITKEMLTSRGIDPERVIIAQPESLEKFKHHAVKLLTAYEEAAPSKRPKMMMILDSLSMLPSAKEVEDASTGKEARDMTKSGLIRGIFRVLTLRCAKAKVPLIINSHVYAAVGAYIPTSVIAGGGGLIYAATTIIELRKKRERDEKTKEVTGILITAKQVKGRIAKADSAVELRLSYTKGLDKYHGLMEIGEKHGIFTKMAKGYQLPDGTKVTTKELETDLKKILNDDLMERLEKACNEEFVYGSGEPETD